MRKLILLMFFISISCKNDQLSEGMFSGVFTDGYNLKFINQSKKAILFLPNQIVCNEYNFDQLELDVKKIDNNAIQLNYSNKDLKYSDLKNWATYCLEYTPTLTRMKWEDAKGLKEGYVNPNYIVDRISENPLDIKYLSANEVYLKNKNFLMKLWNTFYYSGYNGNLYDFYQLINTNNEAIKDLYELAIKEKEILKYLKNKRDFDKYKNLTFEEFKTLLDIGYVNLVNQDYLNVVKYIYQINYISNTLINKILIVNNLEKEITIGEGNKVFFKRLKTK